MAGLQIAFLPIPAPSAELGCPVLNIRDINFRILVEHGGGLRGRNTVPPKSPKKKSDKRPGKSSTSFALFREWFTEAKQYFIALPLAISAFLAFTTYVADTLHWPDPPPI